MHIVADSDAIAAAAILPLVGTHPKDIFVFSTTQNHQPNPHPHHPGRESRERPFVGGRVGSSGFPLPIFWSLWLRAISSQPWVKEAPSRGFQPPRSGLCWMAPLRSSGQVAPHSRSATRNPSSMPWHAEIFTVALCRHPPLCCPTLAWDVGDSPWAQVV